MWFLGGCVWNAFAEKDSRLHQISFDAQDARGRQKRFVVVLGLLQYCWQGHFLRPHQSGMSTELGSASRTVPGAGGSTFGGEGQCRGCRRSAFSNENPYDTIALQAAGIGYRADYAYHNGKYYVYFGIVPVLLLYLPYYLLTGGALQNYVAVFVFLQDLSLRRLGLSMN